MKNLVSAESIDISEMVVSIGPESNCWAFRSKYFTLLRTLKAPNDIKRVNPFFDYLVKNEGSYRESQSNKLLSFVPFGPSIVKKG